MMRRLRELDRLDAEATWPGPPGHPGSPGSRPRRRVQRRLTTTVVLLAVLALGVWSFLVKVMGYDVGLTELAGGRPGSGRSGRAP